MSQAGGQLAKRGELIAAQPLPLRGLQSLDHLRDALSHAVERGIQPGKVVAGEDLYGADDFIKRPHCRADRNTQFDKFAAQTDAQCRVPQEHRRRHPPNQVPKAPNPHGS